MPMKQNAISVFLLSVFLLSGCSSRLPQVGNLSHKVQQFDTIESFIYCHEIQIEGGERKRVIVDYIGTWGNFRTGKAVFSDIIYYNEKFVFDASPGTYDTYSIRGAGRNIDDPHETHFVLFCQRGSEVVRWQGVPGSLGSDGYNLTISSPQDGRKLYKWMHDGPDEARDSIINAITSGRTPRVMPSDDYFINSHRDSAFIMIYCGKIMTFFFRV